MVVEIKRRYGPDHIDFRRLGHGGIISRLGAELPGKNSLPQRSNVSSAGPLFGMEECDMAANRTQRYGLHLWEPGDNFLREEFNENFLALDGGAARVVYGSYLGDGTEGRVFGLGFTPRAVMVKRPDNYEDYHHTNEVAYAPAVAVRGVGGNTLNVVEGGFRVSGHGLVNGAQTRFVYVAFG